MNYNAQVIIPNEKKIVKINVNVPRPLISDLWVFLLQKIDAKRVK